MFKNTLCTREDCIESSDCRHRGPKGEYCFYDVEKKLCTLLGKKWEQNLNLDDLLREVERYFENETQLTSRLAERMQPPKLQVNDDPTP